MNEHPNSEQLTDYLHRALAPEDDASVYAHLVGCADCAAAYEREARLGEALREHARSTERPFPEGVLASVRARVAAANSRSIWESLRAFLRPALLVPVAAIAAVAFIVLPRFVMPQAPPRIAAGYYLEDHAEMNGTMPFADGTTAVPVSLESGDLQTGAASALTIVTTNDAP